MKDPKIRFDEILKTLKNNTIELLPNGWQLSKFSHLARGIQV